jgi:hypothetical protein
MASTIDLATSISFSTEGLCMLRLTLNALPASEKLLSDMALEAGIARMDRAMNPKAGKQAGSPFVPDHLPRIQIRCPSPSTRKEIPTLRLGGGTVCLQGENYGESDRSSVRVQSRA